MEPSVDLFRPLAIGRVMEHHALTGLDIGSRGGFERDLAAMAFAVDAVGFEPEAEAFASLRGQPKGPWRSLRHLPAAIGTKDGPQTLHVARDPNSTSLLCPDPAIGAAFDKQQFFDVVRILEVECRRLDSVVAEAGLERPAYLKIDVEGAELDILKAATQTLPHLLVIKTEVGFLRFRHGQPIAAEIELFLRDQGFELLDFVDATHWRINGYVIHPQSGAGGMPYSRGQLMQGDYLFFRRPDTVAEPERLFQLAALAMAHGFFDYAEQVLVSPDMVSWLRREHGVEAAPLLAQASRAYGRMVWRKAVTRHLRLLWTFGRSAFNLLQK